jgi:hypothetical protein
MLFYFIQIFTFVKHIFGLVYYLSILYQGVTHMENDLLFCSKLMFTNNGKIIVYEFMIQFYSYLYFCQSYS